MGVYQMGIIDRVKGAFDHPENWVEFECEDCGTTVRMDRGDERVCTACGSSDLAFLRSA